MKSLGLDRLSIDERISLVEELWNSIASTSGEVELTKAHRQDLRRRLDAYRDDPQAGSPWEEIKDRLLSRGRLE
jgi:putative addiction module component (TIGR02574 family)